MEGAALRVELEVRRGKLLEALEPFYGAERFLLRVKNIVDTHTHCFEVDEKEWTTRLADGLKV